ncbi:MAG: hypothetical protein WCO60_10625 [Verrucomicrobiota bacterium]
MRHLPPSVSRLLFTLAFLCGWILCQLTASAQFPPPSPLSSAPASAEGTTRKGPTHDVIDETTLRGLAQTANQHLASLAQKTRPASTPPSSESSLLTSSILISDGDHFTIVPIGCVLHLPATLRSRVIPKPKGDVLFWPDFLKRNSSWITAKEVSLPMAHGDTKEARAILKQVETETRIVIAVYSGCPITILEPAQSTPAQSSPTSSTAINKR